MKLKYTLLAATALLPVTISAYAADLPSRLPPAVLPPPPVFTWTGFYVGGQVGYQWSSNSAGNVYAVVPGTAVAASPNYNSAGVIGGGHVGYNWQMNQFVLGIEGDGEGSSFYGSGPYGGGAYRFMTTQDVQGSVRGRLGYAWNQLLIYATGGVAFGSVKNSYTNYAGAVGIADIVSSTRTGWTVGGGFEYFFRPQWSLRGEYRYTDLGTHTDILANSSGATLAVSKHQTENSARFGVSYHFSFLAPPVPAVAKY
jgi:outer membrane immunogenic protein